MTSEGRYQRKVRRNEATGWKNARPNGASHARWVKSFRNVKVYDEYGFPYFAHSRPMLIKNGGKP